MGIRAYALVGFFIISLMFTQYAFAQLVGCGPNEVLVGGVCVNAFDDEPSGSRISVETDRSSYNDGDTIIISGNVEIIESDILVLVTILIVDSTGNIVSVSQVMPNSSGDYSHSILAGGTMEDSGIYEVRAQYGTQKASTTFYFESVSATGPPITVSTDRTSYNDGDTITISGNVGDRLDNFPVALRIISPVGDLVTIEQLDVRYDNTFNTVLRAGGLLWEYSGTYTVNVQYGSGARTASTTFYFSGSTVTGGTTSSINVEGFGVGYQITGGNILSITVDEEIWALIITISTTNSGQLTITLPRALIDAKIGGSDDDFIVIVNRVEANFDETKTDLERTLTIYFPYRASEIEILGTFVIGSGGGIPTSPNTVFIPLGSSVPGCEQTNECWLPAEITVNVGDTVKWENKDSAAHTVTSGSAADGPDGTFDSNMLMLGQTFSHTFRTSGEYPYFDLLHPWMAGVVIVEGAPSSGIVDIVPPLLLTPSDMTIDASDSSGARVDYSVKAIDDNDGILRPNCSPSSGSLFPIGKTTVTCSATDFSGNSDRKSFVITVNAPDVLIPSWIKDVAGFWCGDEIDDASFIEALQYLINNDVIIVPTTTSSGSGVQEIPNWVKSNACWWSQGLISNSDFASGLQYLIGQGIIRV